ncbi:MAG: hypothetical protein IAG10_20865 [Planctomycetaceae bacterium]|nr:hypothetical protein [Planctomycetaceae bacterium]
MSASFAEEPKGGVAAKIPVFRVPLGNDWKIEIVPGPAIGPSPVPKAQFAARQAAQAETKPAAVESASGIVTAGIESAMPAGITPAAYAEVYNSIPFRRSEYLANPSYRHEATIEILLGQIRPKTVTSVSAPSATCCSPRAVSFVGLFNPWGAKNYYYHYSYSRPSSYWVW